MVGEEGGGLLLWELQRKETVGAELLEELELGDWFY